MEFLRAAPAANEHYVSQNSPLFTAIVREQRERVCPSGRIVSVRHRGVIYRQGDAADSVFCVLDGQVVFARLSRDGAIYTTAALGTAELFGPALSGAEYAEDTAKAKGTVSIWRAPVGEFRHMLIEQPELALELVSNFGLRQRLLERRLESLAFNRTETRLAELFHELSGGFATRCEHGFGQHLRLTQQELADLVGASRPVVSTILNRLRTKGVLGYSREYVCVRAIKELEEVLDG